ncbi:TorF family putative porin [Sphingomonas sp. MMS24-JH45]
MIAIAIATLLSGAAATHQVDHRGQRYDVAHRAQVETRARTVGAATGSKPGIQRCRWTSTVRVERTIVRGGAAATTPLPGARTLERDGHGACAGGAMARCATRGSTPRRRRWWRPRVPIMRPRWPRSTPPARAGGELMRHGRYALAVGAMLVAAPAAAQTPEIAGSVEVATDARVRGLSWSDGRPVLAASVAVPLGDWRLDVRGTSLRGSRRHDGADLGLDTAIRYTRNLGGWRASAGAIHHAFLDIGAASNYVELEAGREIPIVCSTSPTADWAPSQDAIGGDNLYLRAGASAWVPGTPYTVFGHVGRSMGGDGRERATRLRPDGDYTDWRPGSARSASPGAADAGRAAHRHVDRHPGAADALHRPACGDAAGGHGAVRLL